MARPKVVWTEPTSEQSTVDAACAAAAGWAAFLLAIAACGLSPLTRPDGRVHGLHVAPRWRRKSRRSSEYSDRDAATPYASTL